MGHWGGGQGGMGGALRGGSNPRAGGELSGTDGWDDEELGRAYDHAVVRRLIPYLSDPGCQRQEGLDTGLGEFEGLD